MEVTLSNLQANSDLWYKIHVLVHDLCSIATDRAAEARTLRTTNELYISAPYFTPEEAELIRATVVSSPTLRDIPEFEALELPEDANLGRYGPATGTEEPATEESVESVATTVVVTVEEAITSCLRNFFAKRRASGDARPCGPHDMGPVYKAVFGITTDELKDEKFVSRLRRAGLGEPRERAASGEVKSKQKKRGAKNGYN